MVLKLKERKEVFGFRFSYKNCEFYYRIDLNKLVLNLTEEEMYWAKLPPNKRDYCAQHLMDLQRCRKENFPFVGKCSHYKHEWDECQNQE